MYKILLLFFDKNKRKNYYTITISCYQQLFFQKVEISYSAVLPYLQPLVISLGSPTFVDIFVKTCKTFCYNPAECFTSDNLTLYFLQ